MKQNSTPSKPRDWLFAQLPDKQIGLAEAIERKQRNPLNICLREDAISPTDPNPDAPACYVSRNGGVIQLRSWGDVSVNAVTHELLHLERYIENSIPQLTPKSSSEERWKITSDIENTLEHLSIVPLEREYGFDPAPYWRATFKSNWDNLLERDFNEFALKKNAMLGYTTLPLAEDAQLEAQVSKILDEIGFLEEAVEFRSKMNRLKPEKAKQLAYVCKSLGISRGDVELQRYFPQNWAKKYPLPNS